MTLTSPILTSGLGTRCQGSVLSGFLILSSVPLFLDLLEFPAFQTLTLDPDSFWTFQQNERYVSSSTFLGTLLSILTLLPGRNVRKTL